MPEVRVSWVRDRMEKNGYKLVSFVRHPFDRCCIQISLIVV